MPKYCVATYSKHKKGDIKGLQNEVNRTFDDKSKYKNGIDWERTPNNIIFAKSDDWYKTITETLEKNNIKPRKDAVLFTTSVYGFSSEWESDLLKTKSQDEVDEIKRNYFTKCYEFEQTRGECFSAIVHVDEGGNWHMQCATVPIVDHPSKVGQKSLSAKTVFGNKKKMSQEQDRFYNQCGKPFGMERGKCRIETSENVKHLTEAEYKARKEREVLDKQKETFDRNKKDLDEQLRRYLRRSSELREREKENKAKAEQLSNQEYALKARRNALDAREDTLSSKESIIKEKAVKIENRASQAIQLEQQAREQQIRAKRLIEEAQAEREELELGKVFRNVWNMIKIHLPEQLRNKMNAILDNELKKHEPTKEEYNRYVAQEVKKKAHRRLPSMSWLDDESMNKDDGYDGYGY